MDTTLVRDYRQGTDWISRNYLGQAHNEISWASRLHIPLQFLLGPAPASPAMLKPGH